MMNYDFLRALSLEVPAAKRVVSATSHEPSAISHQPSAFSHEVPANRSPMVKTIVSKNTNPLKQVQENPQTKT